MNATGCSDIHDPVTHHPSSFSAMHEWEWVDEESAALFEIHEGTGIRGGLLGDLQRISLSLVALEYRRFLGKNHMII